MLFLKSKETKQFEINIKEGLIEKKAVSDKE
jgi:hypothetical protein